MIASWRGLLLAAAIAVVLLIAVVVDLMRSADPVDRALVPGFAADQVTELVWERAGQPASHVVRAGEAWEIRPPFAATPAAAIHAESRAIGDVLAALRGARWHRAGAPTPVHATLTVVAGGARMVLGLGEPIAGTDQTWIIEGTRGLVVDSYRATRPGRPSGFVGGAGPQRGLGRCPGAGCRPLADHGPARLQPSRNNQVWAGGNARSRAPADEYGST